MLIKCKLCETVIDAVKCEKYKETFCQCTTLKIYRNWTNFIVYYKQGHKYENVVEVVTPGARLIR